jgi:predicted component of type VI protein secretion system
MSSMDAKLVLVGGEAKSGEYRLKLPTVIGRGRESSLALPHPLVSRRHCEIYEADGQLMVRDLGSLNGTFVGNKRITEAPLPAGELLTIGAVTFRAVYGDAEELQPPSNNGPAPAAKSGPAASSSSETMRAPAGKKGAGTSPPEAPAGPREAEEAEDVDFLEEPLDADHAAAANEESTGKSKSKSKPKTPARKGELSETIDVGPRDSTQPAPDDDDLSAFLKSLE